MNNSVTIAAMELDREFFEETKYPTLHHAFRAVMKPGERGIMTWNCISKRGDLDLERVEESGRIEFTTFSFKRLSKIQRETGFMCIILRVFEKNGSNRIPKKRIYSFYWSESGVHKFKQEVCEEMSCLDAMTGKTLPPEKHCTYM
jgi:hypothetical protein